MQHRLLPYPQHPTPIPKLTSCQATGILVIARSLKDVLGLSGGVPRYCSQVRNLHFLRRRLFRLLYLHSDHMGLNHELLAVLRTNCMDALPLKLIDQYARPMTIKYTIIEFH